MMTLSERRDTVLRYASTIHRFSMSEPKRTHAAQSAWQDCHVESGPVTVVASSVPRGHVIVVVQDAVARLVPRGCGETRQVNNGRTMHLCQNRCHCGETTENYCTAALPRRSKSSLACWRVVSRAAYCNTPVFFSADHTSADEYPHEDLDHHHQPTKSHPLMPCETAPSHHQPALFDPKSANKNSRSLSTTREKSSKTHT